VTGSFAGKTAKSVVVEGSLAYLITDDPPGLQILDVSQPMAAKELGFYEGGPFQQERGDIVLSGDHAYAPFHLSGLSTVGIAVFDVSDPANPFVQTMYTDGDPSVAIFYDTLWLEGDLLIATTTHDANFELIDVSNPGSPVKLGESGPEGLCSVGTFNDAYVTGGIAYLAASEQLSKVWWSGEPGLCIYDVSDPTKPALIGDLWTPGGAFGIQVVGEIAYLATGHGLMLIDVSDPHDPTPISSAGINARSVFVQGPYAFTSGYGLGGDCGLNQPCIGSAPGGIELFDVSDPLSPVPIATRRVPAQSWGFPFVSQNRVFLPTTSDANQPAGLLIWQFDQCLCDDCPEGQSCKLGTCVPSAPKCSDPDVARQWDGCTSGIPSETQLPGALISAWRYYGLPTLVSLADGSLLASWVALHYDWCDWWDLFGPPSWMAGDLMAVRIGAGDWPWDGDVSLDEYGLFAPGGTASTSSGFVTAWYTILGDDRVLARRFDLQGTAVGDEFLVAEAGTWARPVVASLPDGGFIVAWADGSSLRTRLFSQDATPKGSETIFAELSIPTPDLHHLPVTLAVSPSGGFLASWSATGFVGDNDGAVVAGIFDAEANQQGPEFPVHEWTKGAQRHPASAALAGSKFVVTWESELQDGDGVGVFARLFDSDGTPLGAEFQVPDVPLGDQLTPAAAALQGGGFAVTWAGQGAASSHGIFVRRFDAAGQPLGSQVNASAFDYGVFSSGAYPAIVGTADGGFLVAWVNESFHEFCGLTDVGVNLVAQQFDAAGAKVFNIAAED
jgi:hypothetical protein